MYEFNHIIWKDKTMKTGRKKPKTVGENRGMTKQDTENISGCKSPLFDIIMKYIL